MITDGKLFYKSILDKLLSGFALHKVILNKDKKPADYEFIEVNKAFENIIGIKTNDIIRTKCSELKTFQDFKWIENYNDVINKNIQKSIEYYVEKLHRWYQADMYSPEPNYIITIFNEITMLKLVEKRIEETDNKYRRLVEIANEGIWQINQEFEIIYLNNQMAAMLGYTRDEMLRKKVFKYLFEEDIEHAKDLMRIRKQGDTSQYERRFKHKDSSEVWTLISGSPILNNKDKSFTGTIAMVFNITERKKLEQEFIKSQLNLHAIINNASDDMVILLEANHNFVEVNETFLKTTGLKREDIIGKYANDYIPHEVKRERNKIIEKVKYIGKPITHEDHARGKDWLHSFYPVKDDSGKVINIVIFSKDISERNKIQKELLLNRLNLKAIINALEFIVIQVDINKKILEVNDYYCKLLDKNREEVINKDLYKLLPDNVREYRLKTFETIKQTGIPFYHEDFARERYWYNSVFPVKEENGEIIQFVIFSEDITERKRMEQKALFTNELLQKSEERFRSYFESSPNPILILDKLGKIINSNKASYRNTGYTDIEMMNMSIFDFISEKDIERAKNAFNVLIKAGANSVELCVKYKKLREVPVLIDAVRLNDDEYICYWKDISRIRKAEEYKYKEKQYLETVKLAKIGSWTSDVINNQITWSDEMYDILGFDKKNGAPNYEETNKELFPYDWEEYERNKQLAINEAKPYKQILTVKTPEGVVKKVVCKTNCEKDKEGKVVKLFGIVQDITDLV